MTLLPLGDGWHDLSRRAGADLERQLSRELPQLPLGKLGRMLDLVVTWNARTDLTAARGPEELVDLYLADALVVATAEGDLAGRWVDVGTGGGAPGLTLATLAETLNLTLVEPRDKRVAFLRTVVGELELSQVRVKRARSDAIADSEFDVAISRATLPPAEWLAEGARLSTSSVWVLLARGEAPELAGWRPDLELAYLWPLTRASRRALRYVPESSAP
jgi:16S rRNA (guanine527-N7)-methyltransferase